MSRRTIWLVLGISKISFAAQGGDGAADGFDRKAEVVGDVLAAHRQIQTIAAGQVRAIGQAEKERGNPFARLLAAQHKQVLLRRQQTG